MLSSIDNKVGHSPKHPALSDAVSLVALAGLCLMNARITLMCRHPQLAPPIRRSIQFPYYFNYKTLYLN